MNDYFGIKDNEFIRGNVPMTKEEVRVITISKLRLSTNDRVCDIGAGTGSISIEIARVLKTGFVYAVECITEGIELIKKNSLKFGVSNIEVIEGKAPENLNGIKNIDKIVVGGSGGNLEKIVEWSMKNLKGNGRIVINSVTFDTLTDSKMFLEKSGFSEIEIIQVGVNKFEETGNVLMLKAQNPVFIISATKGK
jgi:precorrin-6Y C5,15-methyltransferase (decarboxylating) CbiT subunit